MRKKGYTLSEVLIAVTIIGIVAATILPLVNRIKPDDTKIKYLQTYDAINKVITDLVNNRSYFPVYNNGDRYRRVFVDRPFANTEGITLADGRPIQGGRGKICRLLHAVMGNEQDNNCTNNTYRTVNMSNNSNFTQSFTTKNGMTMVVYTTRPDIFVNDTTRYQTDIYFDINGDELPNCFKVQNTINTCPQPDRFKIKVAANGYIEPGDRVGNGYLQNRANTRRTSSEPPLVGDAAIEGEELIHYRNGYYDEPEQPEEEPEEETTTEENNEDNTEDATEGGSKPWDKDKLEPEPLPENCLNGGNTSGGIQQACKNIAPNE